MRRNRRNAPTKWSTSRRRGRSPREQQVETRRQQLLDILKKHDVSVPAGADTRVNQYHPPFAPSWWVLTHKLGTAACIAA